MLIIYITPIIDHNRFYFEDIMMTDIVNDDCANNSLRKINEYVKSIQKRESYINSEVEIINTSSKGGSYMGTLYEINIKGKTDDGDKETNVFVKNKILVDEMIYSVDEVYQRELFAYKELSKMFNKLQEEAKVPIEERYKLAYVFEESNGDAIILENLMTKGFKTYFRTDIISIKFAKMAVKHLAKFHGLALVLQLKNHDYFKLNVESMKAPFKFDDFWSNFTKGTTELSLSFLEKKIKDGYENKIKATVQKYPKYILGEDCNVRTLCHGDYRHNNIMMKEIHGTISEILPVDYQMMHFGNPILDFFYLIFWGTDKEFRRKYMNELKQLYYESLKNFLTYFNLEVELLYPKEEFEKQYKEKMDFGIIISTIYLPYLFPKENEEPDLTQSEDIVALSSSRIDSLFQERYRDIIDDFINWGYLG